MFSEERPAMRAWLVCFGEHRDVIAGAVACQLSSSDVPLEECLDCRHLGYVSDERTSRWCSTSAAETAGSASRSPHAEDPLCAT